jgi:hypothetical protein
VIETATYRPAKLLPLTSPVAIREATVRDYARAASRTGAAPSSAELERRAVADCEMADAYMRGIDKSPPLKQKPRSKPAPAPYDPGAGLDLKPGRSSASPEMAADFAKYSARWPFAMGRMKRILAGATPSRDPIQVAMTCEIPTLALAMLRLHRNYLMRSSESRNNPFRGLGEIDARRALVRFVEDICDKSASKMGPWWVPK